ncbi:MAG: DUF1800 domain-containing protein [Planctomycetota bacterium]
MGWEPWTPDQEQPWNLKRVVHLHRRAGFGASWQQLQQDLQEGPDAAVERMTQSVVRGATDSPDDLMGHVGDAAVGSNRPERLKAWWLLRMLTSTDPLREKLTLMWHNHFATSNAKVANLAAMRTQNAIFFSQGAGRFADLLQAVVTDPAMLVWLDAPSNRKGRPNENLAREIMELFTLGIGNYSERDVREAARALTGWSVNDAGRFEFLAKSHDHGNKTILGQTGPWNGHDLLRILMEQDATVERIAWRLCRVFMSVKQVPSALVSRLAEHLRSTGMHIGSALQTILRSQAFFADENIGSRVSDPAEFVVSTLKALESRSPWPSSTRMAFWTTELGQDLFFPPNVGGWSGGRNWLSSRHVVGRANFVAALINGELSRSRAAPDLAGMVRRNCGDTALGASIAHLNELLLGGRLTEASCSRVALALQGHHDEPEDQIRLALALNLALPEAQQV